jgi:hypothetical protein
MVRGKEVKGTASYLLCFHFFTTAMTKFVINNFWQISPPPKQQKSR